MRPVRRGRALGARGAPRVALDERVQRLLLSGVSPPAGASPAVDRAECLSPAPSSAAAGSDGGRGRGRRRDGGCGLGRRGGHRGHRGDGAAAAEHLELWRMISSCSAISCSTVRRTRPRTSCPPPRAAGIAALPVASQEPAPLRRGSDAVEVGGESVDRRELLEQLAERDLHAERLLERSAAWVRNERVEAELEKRRVRCRCSPRPCPTDRLNRLRRRSTRASRRPVAGALGWVACDWHLILVTIVVDSGVGTARYRFSRRRDPPSGACARTDRSEAERGASGCPYGRRSSRGRPGDPELPPRGAATMTGLPRPLSVTTPGGRPGSACFVEARRAAVPARPRASPAPDPRGAARSPSRSRTGGAADPPSSAVLGLLVRDPVAGQARDPRARRRRSRASKPRPRANVVEDRVHHRGVERVRRREPACDDVALGQRGLEAARSRPSPPRRPSASGAFSAAISRSSGRSSRTSSRGRPHREHRPGGQRLHEPAAFGDEPQRVVAREDAREARGDVLAEGVADHRRRARRPSGATPCASAYSMTNSAGWVTAVCASRCSASSSPPGSG